MSKFLNRNMIVIALLVTLLGTSATSAASPMAPSVMHPTIAVQVFSFNWAFKSSFSTTYEKIGDLATFNVLSSSSIVELVFNGYIRVNTLNLGGSGAIFELRVDDTASEYGPARSRTYKQTEDIPASIDGIFSNLSPGTHVASMWIKGVNAGGTDASVNPYGWETDHLVVKEYTPLGYTFLPSINK
jgi:hypothetical protein